MSVCISRHGEFSGHTLGSTAADERFTCTYCWVLDEDAIYAALASAEAKIARVERLCDQPPHGSALYVIGEVRAALTDHTGEPTQ